MPILVSKVFAYITCHHRLLVFSHPHSPEAGIQVPAGTMHRGELPEDAVMREAFEETGLADLRLNSYLGEDNHPRPDRDEIHRRHFYHLLCQKHPPERWQHYENYASGGSLAPILFEFFWVQLPDEVPELAPGHERMLPKLIDQLRCGI